MLIEIKERSISLLEQFVEAKERPELGTFYKVQNFVLLYLVLFRPTMRSQNFVLEILKSPESPKEASKNGIYFPPSETDPVVLQLTKYKTSQRYGFLQFFLDMDQSSILRKFLIARSWVFPNPDLPSHSFLFLDQRRQPLLRIGKYFKQITLDLLEKNISISSIRKIMESTLSEINIFDKDTRNSLSAAMLHDPATARRYYVSVDMKKNSEKINSNWNLFLSKINVPSALQQSIPTSSSSSIIIADSSNPHDKGDEEEDDDDDFVERDNEEISSPSTYDGEWSPPFEVRNSLHSPPYSPQNPNFYCSPSSQSATSNTQTMKYNWANKRNDSYFDRINCNSQQQFSTLPSPFNNVLSSATPYSPFHYTPAPTQYGHNNISSSPPYSHSHQNFSMLGLLPSERNYPSSTPFSIKRSPTPYYQPYTTPPRSVNKQPGVKERNGDWVCGSCSNYNFSYRLFCKACNNSKFN